MNRELRVIIITGNSNRHYFFVREMEKYFKVLLVISEQKFDYKQAYANSDASEMVNFHFNLRDESELAFFGDTYPETELYPLRKGEVNAPETVEMLRQLNADFVLLYGSSIIKKPILEYYAGKVINLHLGLSPYYRGSGTNFWPIVDGLLECVGATIHLAVPKVDAGPVLHQVRPDNVVEMDSIHDLGNKTIITAIQALPKVITAYFEGRLEPIEQIALTENEFKRVDLNQDSIKKAYSNLEKGLVQEYLNHRLERNNLYPIIEFKTTKNG